MFRIVELSFKIYISIITPKNRMSNMFYRIRHTNEKRAISIQKYSGRFHSYSIPGGASGLIHRSSVPIRHDYIICILLKIYNIVTKFY